MKILRSQKKLELPLIQHLKFTFHNYFTATKAPRHKVRAIAQRVTMKILRSQNKLCQGQVRKILHTETKSKAFTKKSNLLK